MDSSTFGSDFSALIFASELIISFRCNILIFSIPILCHAEIFSDNEDVYKNIYFFELTLKNKYNPIFFRRVREPIADVIMIFHKVHTKYNLADILDESLSAEDWVRLRSMIMIDAV